MKYQILIAIVYLLLSLDVLGQSPSIQWEKTLGGSDEDVALSIQQIRDGGYIVAGYTKSSDGDIVGYHGNSDCWVVKLDNTGNIEWQKSLGGTEWEIATSIKQTTDNGYILSGSSQSNNGDVSGHHGSIYYHDYWVVKLDSMGNLLWQKSLGGNNNDLGNSIQQTVDGGYIVAGLSYSNSGDVTDNHGDSDYWVVKLDTSGNILWQKCFGGTNGEGGEYHDIDINPYIQQTTDGGYVMAGRSYSNDGDVTGHHGTSNYADYWVVKIDSIGNLLWQKSLGGTNDDFAYCIQQTIDGNYIVAGISKSNDGDVSVNHGAGDAWIVKINTEGNILWEKTYGGAADDDAYSLKQTSDKGYIIAGFTDPIDTSLIWNSSYWIIRLDSLGTILWQKKLGGTNVDQANSVQQTIDEGYIAAGFTGSHNGDVSDYHGALDFWVVKINATANINESAFINPIKIYPNPANIFCTLNNLPKNSTIALLDFTGKEIFITKNNIDQLTLDTANLPAGIYTIRIEANDIRVTKNS